jgi:hypothetical protein
MALRLDVKTYRPISNLTVLSKLLERLVSQQLTTYLKDNRLLPDLQSAYRVHHSTETAVLKVLSDTLLALDSGDLAVLTLLDLSAAFDSVDHETLLSRLQQSYGLEGTVFDWCHSYLVELSAYIRRQPSQYRRWFHMAFHKSPFLAQFYSPCTLPMCCSW